MIEPLPVGSYELSFGGTFIIKDFGPVSQDNIYQLLCSISLFSCTGFAPCTHDG